MAGVGSPLCDRMLVGMTGTIGIYDFLYFVEAFRGGIAREVRVIQTPTAARMLDPHMLSTIAGCEVWSDPWDDHGGVKVPHVELPAWAELFLVLPATAHVLSSAARGDGSALLPLAILASPRPVGFVPHMNRTMWQAPATRRNVAQLREDGHLVLDPDSGTAFAQEVADRDAPQQPAPSPGDVQGFIEELARASGIDVPDVPADRLALAREAEDQVRDARRTFSAKR